MERGKGEKDAKQQGKVMAKIRMAIYYSQFSSLVSTASMDTKHFT